jgi:hypothetical protein
MIEHVVTRRLPAVRQVATRIGISDGVGSTFSSSSCS